MTRWFSLRRHLLGLLLGGIALIWTATMTLSYFDAHHEIDELFDAQLAQSAQTLLALASHDDQDGRIGDLQAVGEAAHVYQRRLKFQLWHADGRLAMRSENAPETPLTGQAGFAERVDADTTWRTFTQWNRDHSLQVQVAEDHAIRVELTSNIAWRLLLPALLGLPLIGLGAWLATARGLRSLDEIARQITERKAAQLQPIIPASAPGEIRPMLDALNQLLDRLDKALDAERHFTADAAHELRTPLAALQAQLQVACRARDDGEREHAQQQMQDGLNRAKHLIEQLLILARLDPQSGLPSPAPVDLDGLCTEVCAELGTGILAKGIDFHLTGHAGTLIEGQSEWLRVMIRNLLENAIRHTPPEGRLDLQLGRDGQDVFVRLTDSGPGIPASERERVLHRFHRLQAPDDLAQDTGSGLGLSIVRKIVELHGARLMLADAPHPPGLQVSVLFRI